MRYRLNYMLITLKHTQSNIDRCSALTDNQF